MKKLLSIIISGTLVFGALPQIAFADDPQPNITVDNCEAAKYDADHSSWDFYEETEVLYAEGGTLLKFQSFDGISFPAESAEWTVEKVIDEVSTPVDYEYSSNVYDGHGIIYVTMPDEGTLSVKLEIVDNVAKGKAASEFFKAYEGISLSFQKVAKGNGVTRLDVSAFDDDTLFAFNNTMTWADIEEAFTLGPLLFFPTITDPETHMPLYFFAPVTEYSEEEEDLVPVALDIIRTPFAKDINFVPDVDSLTLETLASGTSDYYELGYNAEFKYPYMESLSFSAGKIDRNLTINLLDGSETLYGEDALRTVVFSLAAALAYEDYVIERDEEDDPILTEDFFENGFFKLEGAFDDSEEDIVLYINLDDDSKNTYDISVNITSIVNHIEDGIERVKEEIGALYKELEEKGLDSNKIDYITKPLTLRKYFDLYSNLPLEIEKTAQCSANGNLTLSFPTALNEEVLALFLTSFANLIDGEEEEDDESDLIDMIMGYVHEFTYDTVTFKFPAANSSVGSSYKANNKGGGGGGGAVRLPLTFDTNGGSDIGSKSYPLNEDVYLNEVPLREGYTFTGWYADKALTEKITAVNMNSAKTVYAGWAPVADPAQNENTEFMLTVVIDSTEYMLNGEDLEMDSAPFIDENDRTMLPVRVVANALGISDEDIVWDNETKTASFTRPDGKVVSCTVGSNIIKIGDEEITIDTAPVLKNDRIYLPLRALFNAFNVSDENIVWDAQTRSVRIKNAALDDINALAPVED